MCFLKVLIGVLFSNFILHCQEQKQKKNTVLKGTVSFGKKRRISKHKHSPGYTRPSTGLQKTPRFWSPDKQPWNRLFYRR